MEQSDILFIAEILTDELRQEVRNYNEFHSRWVKDLIKAIKRFYDDNSLYDAELERLIKEYNETKEWIDSQTNKGE